MNQKAGLLIANVADNAMLYKDITQWLRNRTFLLLFFGLLAIAEVTTALVVLVTRTEENLGAVSFSVLSTVLFIYALIIAFLGHNLTAREFFNRTFELYELSGMSLERMVWGKLLSMLVQFSFGFFCLVPFMFVAFMLGGLDFYLVVTVSVLIVLAIVPIYLLALFVALLSKSRQVSGIVRGIILVILFLFLPWWGLVTFIELTMMRSMSGSPVEFMKLLMTLDAGAVKSMLIFLGFYVQICLLLFYLCCNAISPTTDSRATSIHVLALTLSLSYLAMMLWQVATSYISDETGYVMYVPLMIVFLVVGLISFYGRPDTPIMALKRLRSARFPLARWIYYWFAPGVHGAVRTLGLFFALLVGSWIVSVVTAPTVPMEFHNAAACAMQMPFFLAFPGILLIRSRRLAGSVTAMRTAILMWWIMLGFPLMITAMIMRFESYYQQTLNTVIVSVLALLISPFSTPFAGSEGFIFLRMMLGIGGCAALWHMMKLRAVPEPILAPTRVA